MQRKRAITIVIILVIVAVTSFAATYAYANYFGPKTVL